MLVGNVRYDMNKPRLILLVGIPGSGKTIYARKYVETTLNTIHLSSDAIRKELYGRGGNLPPVWL